MTITSSAIPAPRRSPNGRRIQAIENQLKNIETRTGKTLSELSTLIRNSGLAKHGEIREWLKQTLAMGHGDANTLTHDYLNSRAENAAKASGITTDQVLDDIYTGLKASLRPIHDKLMTAINTFGTFDIAPKTGYVSLRRKKQFAMIGPTTKSRVEVGLNMKNIDPTNRLVALPSGSMCQYKVDVTHPDEVDNELVAWIRTAFDSAG